MLELVEEGRGADFCIQCLVRKVDQKVGGRLFPSPNHRKAHQQQDILQHVVESTSRR